MDPSEQPLVPNRGLGRQQSSFLSTTLTEDEHTSELAAVDALITGLQAELRALNVLATSSESALSTDKTSKMIFLTDQIHWLTKYKKSTDAVALYLAYSKQSTCSSNYFTRACCLKTFDPNSSAFMVFLKRVQEELGNPLNHRPVLEQAESFIQGVIALHQQSDNGPVIPAGFGRMLKHPLSLIPVASTVGLTLLLLYVDHRTSEHADSRFLGFDYLALLQCALLLTAGKLFYAGLLVGAAKLFYKDDKAAFVHQASKSLYEKLTVVQSEIFRLKIRTKCPNDILDKMIDGVYDLVTNKFFALPALIVAGFMSSYSGSYPFGPFHLKDALVGSGIGILGVLPYFEGHWFRQGAAKGIACVASCFSYCCSCFSCCNRGARPMTPRQRQARVWAPGSKASAAAPNVLDHGIDPAESK